MSVNTILYQQTTLFISDAPHSNIPHHHCTLVAGEFFCPPDTLWNLHCALLNVYQGNEAANGYHGEPRGSACLYVGWV
jgi:hypothetical protein